MNVIIDFIKREPVAIVGLIDALLLLLVTFGLPITEDQKKAVDTVLAAVVLLLAGVARQQVTPVAAPNLEDSHVVPGV